MEEVENVLQEIVKSGSETEDPASIFVHVLWRANLWEVGQAGRVAVMEKSNTSTVTLGEDHEQFAWQIPK